MDPYGTVKIIHLVPFVHSGFYDINWAPIDSKTNRQMGPWPNAYHNGVLGMKKVENCWFRGEKEGPSIEGFSQQSIYTIGVRCISILYHYK